MFKKGDLVTLNRKPESHWTLTWGKLYNVIDAPPDERNCVKVENDLGFLSDVHVKYLELVNNNNGHQFESISNNNNMSVTEKFLIAFKSEPEKSFRKTGITNGDDILTEEGQTVFLSWLLKKHGDEFKKEVVDPILKEKKDENK